MDSYTEKVCKQILFEKYEPENTLDNFDYDIDFCIQKVPKEKKISSIKKYSDYLLHEYLFDTYDRNILLNENDMGASLTRIRQRLIDNYHMKDWQFDVQEFANDVEGFKAQRLTPKDVAICIPDIENNKDIICQVMEQEGYFLITQHPRQFDEDTDLSWIILSFAPKIRKRAAVVEHDNVYIPTKAEIEKEEAATKIITDFKETRCKHIH